MITYRFESSITSLDADLHYPHPLSPYLSLLLIQLLRLHILPEDIPSNKIWYLSKPIHSVNMSRYAENLIEFFKRLAFRFLSPSPISTPSPEDKNGGVKKTHRQKQKHQRPPYEIPPSIPPKRPLRLESFQQTRPRDTQHEVEKPSGRRSQTHSEGSDIQRIGFSRVGERHRAFAGGVYNAEEVDAEGDATDAGARGGWNPEGEAGEEEE